MRETEPREWVLVSGDFVRHGGMDRANYELARWLAARGTRVRLVTHRVDPDLAAMPTVETELVPRPLGAHALGGLLLDRVGVRVARAAAASAGGARVLVNGANCRYYDVNWVHAVHAAWPVLDDGAPLRIRAKNRIDKWRNRRKEARIVGRARIVLANSEKTRHELVTRAGVDAQRVHVVYLGSDPKLDRPAAPEAVAARRRALGIAPAELLILFIGALGHDRNKGLDTLLDAWARLRQHGGPRGRILALGSAVPRWQREIASRGLAADVHLLGFRADAGDLLGAADLLVAPSRYDSYGLSVQEALCRNVAAIVSSRAGVSERYPAALRPLVLGDPEDARALAGAIASWARERERYAAEVAALGATLREHTWARMSEQIAAVVEGPP
jgi:glycosyltransferase involved in cell wall biosynthesis